MKRGAKMDSDSDRTIDSDELEEIISRAKAEQGSSTNGKKQKLSPKNLKRTHLFHDISESDSDDNIKVRKIEKKNSKSPKKKVDANADNRPVCKYGSNCYRKNPDHKREFYHPSKF